MADVFLSYAWNDREAVQPLVTALDQAGFGTDANNLLAEASGKNWSDVLTSRIDASGCVVVIWSKAAAQSAFVQQEIQQAIRAWSSNRLALVTLDAAPLPVGLRDIEAVAVQDRYDAAAKELIERVGAILGAREIAFSPSEPRHSLREPPRPAIEALPAQPIEKWAAEEIEPAPEACALPPYSIPTSGRSLRRPIWRRVFIAIIVFIAIARGLLAVMDIWPTTAHLAPSQGIGRDAPVMGPILVVLIIGVFLGAAAFWGGSAVIRRWRSHSVARLESTRRADAANHVRNDEETGRRVVAALESLQQAVVAENARKAGQVFVSYSHVDGPAVDQLVQQIEKLGYAVWIDRQAGGSQRYAAPIVRAIRVSNLVALMCSKNSFASDHVIREIYLAGDYKKPFIAFLLDPTDFPDEILYFLTGFPRVPVAAIDPEKLRSAIARVIAA
jgi:hypothetical protein